jgi:hypothetical protein
LAAPGTTRARLESICPFFGRGGYINVTDVDNLYEEYKSKGLVFHSPLGVNSDELRGFELQDADGYVLYFGRMAKPGDSPVG